MTAAKLMLAMATMEKPEMLSKNGERMLGWASSYAKDP